MLMNVCADGDTAGTQHAGQAAGAAESLKRQLTRGGSLPHSMHELWACIQAD